MYRCLNRKKKDTSAILDGRTSEIGATMNTTPQRKRTETTLETSVEKKPGDIRSYFTPKEKKTPTRK